MHVFIIGVETTHCRKIYSLYEKIYTKHPVAVSKVFVHIFQSFHVLIVEKIVWRKNLCIFDDAHRFHRVRCLRPLSSVTDFHFPRTNVLIKLWKLISPPLERKIRITKLPSILFFFSIRFPDKKSSIRLVLISCVHLSCGC